MATSTAISTSGWFEMPLRASTVIAPTRFSAGDMQGFGHEEGYGMQGSCPVTKLGLNHFQETTIVSTRWRYDMDALWKLKRCASSWIAMYIETALVPIKLTDAKYTALTKNLIYLGHLVPGLLASMRPFKFPSRLEVSSTKGRVCRSRMGPTA